MGISFSFESRDVGGFFKRLANLFRNTKKLERQALEELGVGHVVIMRDAIRQIEYKGDTRRSIQYNVDAENMSVSIGPYTSDEKSMQRIGAIRYGYPYAFTPPFSAIKAWAADKLGDERAGWWLWQRIQGKIPGKSPGISMATGIRPTPGFDFIDMTANSPESDALIDRISEKLGIEIVSKLF